MKRSLPSDPTPIVNRRKRRYITKTIGAKDGKMVAGGILLIPNIMYESSDVGGGGSKQGTVTAVYGHSQEGDYTHANALYDNQDAEYC